jgi:hypothetical protein
MMMKMIIMVEEAEEMEDLVLQVAIHAEDSVL